MTVERTRDLRVALKLEYATLAWMALEFASAVTLGLLSGSLLLLAFGLDSLIELVSAVVIVWQLRVELRGDYLGAKVDGELANVFGGMGAVRAEQRQVVGGKCHLGGLPAQFHLAIQRGGWNQDHRANTKRITTSPRASFK